MGNRDENERKTERTERKKRAKGGKRTDEGKRKWTKARSSGPLTQVKKGNEKEEKDKQKGKNLRNKEQIKIGTMTKINMKQKEEVI